MTGVKRRGVLQYESEVIKSTKRLILSNTVVGRKVEMGFLVDGGVDGVGERDILGILLRTECGR